MCLFVCYCILISLSNTYFYAKMLAATASNIGNRFYEHLQHKDIGKK